MACPDEVTMENLSGKFVLNKSLSDPIDPIQEVQGIGYLLRKTMSMITPSLTIKHFPDASGVSRVVVETSAAAMKGTTEFVLDWSPIAKNDGPFGNVERKSRFYTTPRLEIAGASTEGDRAFLMGETLAKGTTPSVWLEDPTGKHIQTVGTNTSGAWTLEQTWGFEMIDGKRLHTRRMVASNGKKTSRARSVYNFVGA